MKLKWTLWAATACVLFASTVGCKKKENCTNFVDKLIACDKNPEKAKKMKVLGLAICVKQLDDKDMAPYMKRQLACIHKSCGEFTDCHKAIDKEARSIRRIKRLNKALDKIKGFASAKNWKKAQSECISNYYAKTLLKSEDEKGQTAAKAFFAYCLKNVPVWMGHIRDSGKAGIYYTACGKSFKNKFLTRAGATDAQKKNYNNICKEVDFAYGLAKVLKNKAKSIAKKSFPYKCDPKDVAKVEELGSPGAKKLLAQFQQVCYHDLGYPVLEAKYKKIRRKRFKYCGYSEKKIAKAFHKWESLRKPEYKKVLKFFFKLCKLK